MRAAALQRQIHQNGTASHADLDLVWGSVPQPGTGCPGTAVVAPLDQPFISFGATRPKNLMAMGPGGYRFGAY